MRTGLRALENQTRHLTLVTYAASSRICYVVLTALDQQVNQTESCEDITHI